MNPYESPLAAEDKSIERRRERIFRPFEIVMCCGLAILLATAILHCLQLPEAANAPMEDVNTYCQSPLIGIELLALVGVLAVIPLALCRSLYFALQRRWAASAVNLGISCLSPGVVVAAMWIDAPTLIYAT
jgi:hypothetical protein